VKGHKKVVNRDGIELMIFSLWVHHWIQIRRCWLLRSKGHYCQVTN